MEKNLALFFLILGMLFIILSIFFFFFEKLNFFKLPGDIYINKENFKFYFPITTSIILSLILTFLLNFLFKIIKK